MMLFLIGGARSRAGALKGRGGGGPTDETSIQFFFGASRDSSSSCSSSSSFTLEEPAVLVLGGGGGLSPLPGGLEGTALLGGGATSEVGPLKGLGGGGPAKEASIQFFFGASSSRGSSSSSSASMSPPSVGAGADIEALEGGAGLLLPKDSEVVLLLGG